MKAIVRLNRWACRALPDAYEVRPQGPLTLRDSEPEPDLAVVPADRPGGSEEHPRPLLPALSIPAASLFD